MEDFNRVPTTNYIAHLACVPKENIDFLNIEDERLFNIQSLLQEEGNKNSLCKKFAVVTDVIACASVAFILKASPVEIDGLELAANLVCLLATAWTIRHLMNAAAASRRQNIIIDGVHEKINRTSMSPVME